MLHRTTLHRSTLAAALALTVVACEAPPEPAARAASSPGAQPAVHGPGKPARRAVAPEVAARLEPQQVVWPSMAEVDRPVRARFTADDLRAIDVADLPVLAPRDPRMHARATVVVKPTWFSVALKDAAYAAELDALAAGRSVDGLAPGVSVLVQGNRTAHRHPHVAPAVGTDIVRGRPAWITQNESIWSATWQEHGVTYVVEIECSRPSDRRCADDALLREVVESLVLVGGAGPIADPRRGADPQKRQPKGAVPTDAAPTNGGAR